jgi:hypothetical protein
VKKTVIHNRIYELWITAPSTREGEKKNCLKRRRRGDITSVSDRF